MDKLSDCEENKTDHAITWQAHRCFATQNINVYSSPQQVTLMASQLVALLGCHVEYGPLA